MPDYAPPIMRTIVPGKALVIHQQTEWFAGRGEYSWAELASELETNAAALTELRSLVKARVLRFPINYKGADTLLPHLTHARKTCQWFSASAMHNLRNGNVASALDDVEAMTLFTRALEHEPLVISQLVRIAAATIALNTSWQILHSPDVSDAHLERLRDIIGGIQSIEGMVLALQGERASIHYIARVLRTSGFDMESLCSQFGYAPNHGEGISFVSKLPHARKVGDLMARATIPLWRFAWCFEDEWTAHIEIDRFIEASRAGNREQSALAVQRVGNSFESRCSRGGYKFPRYVL
ncbi:MAG: hypothetical protein L0Z53_10225, partial [Acidobacteriales bacterium]|nr:hypothetical protein [Terriglobales bacterium]